MKVWCEHTAISPAPAGERLLCYTYPQDGVLGRELDSFV
jgi:hypothetical protein